MKSTARFFNVADVMGSRFDYIRASCKTYPDDDGSYSHVLGIDIDGSRGDLKAFDNQFSEVTRKQSRCKNDCGN